jgi:hypothetical protein
MRAHASTVWTGLLGLAILASVGAAVPPADKVAEAERLARAAKAKPADPASLADARRALSLTGEFDPRRFVKLGGKGELVEDAYREALARYRSHRALLYEAAGECLVQQGQPRAGVRYARRAVVLDAGGERVAGLARALLKDDRALEGLDFVAQRGLGGLSGELLAAAQQLADAAAVPSLQAELDRVRLMKLTIPGSREPRDGPLAFGERLLLSTGTPFRIDEEGTTVLYVADPSCRSCSSDLEALGKVVPEKTRVVVVPAVPDQDRALRQALEIYNRKWPVLLGARASVFGPKAPVVWVVGRRGWSVAVLSPPFDRELPGVLEVFARHDVDEVLPRPGWNRRPVVRKTLPPQPGLLDEGVAPGEDELAPPEMEQAMAALRAKKPLEARRLFDGLAQRNDGFLLSPEARLNAAVCLSRAGDVAAARNLLRAIGDSRFQDHVDEVLESLSPAASKR